jgi:nucleoside-diphosphate-sugar epimerase
MVLAGYPITIYGKGEQKKPIISLEDCVESIVNAVRLKPAGEFKVYNQVTEVASIIHVAESVVKAGRDLGMDVDIKHIPNPRVEKEEHQMSIDTTNFSKLLKEQKWQISSGSYHILRSLLEHQDLILQYRDRFLTT